MGLTPFLSQVLKKQTDILKHLPFTWDVEVHELTGVVLHVYRVVQVVAYKLKETEANVRPNDARQSNEFSLIAGVLFTHQLAHTHTHIEV